MITQKTGTIQSNPPGEDYRENSNCVWYLQASPSSDSSLSIRIDRLDLEFNYDFVAIHRGMIQSVASGVTGNPLIYLTGPLSLLPTKTLKFQGDSFTIWFHSDGYINGKGFQMTYGLNSCNKPCINGLCLNGTCICDSGYRGETCEDGTCLSIDDCSGKGTCSNNYCVCTPGYYGANCNDSYCVKKSVYTQKSGTFKSNQGFSYLNGQTCSWLISSPGYSTITLDFVNIDTEYEYDLIRVYDGPDASYPLLGIFSGNRIPSPVHSSGGNVFITFESDLSLTRKGFEISWDSYNCPQNCSFKGQCFDGVCSCQTGFTGPTCNTEFCDNNCTFQGSCNVSKCMCNDGYGGADCSICKLPAANCSYAGYEFCESAGRKVRTETSGDLYVYHSADSNTCTWTIQPELPNNDTTLVLTFTEFSMSGINVTIYDGSTDSYLIGQFSGDLAPAKLLVPTGIAQIVISKAARATITSVKRFSLSWELVTCTGGCSDNGVCGFNGCECAIGYNGTNCNRTYCANNCNSPSGSCQSNKCLCNEGYYGADCSELYCSGEVEYRQPSGTIRDHSPEVGAYRRLSNCIFYIRPTLKVGSTISLLFKSFQTEAGEDFVILSNNRGVIGNFSGGYAPLPILSDTPVTVQFISDYRNEFLGFQLDYSVSDECQLGCNNNGYCNNGQCICLPGWTGPACDTVPSYEKLADRITTSGYVDQFNWKVYTYTNRDNVLVTFQLKTQNGRQLFFFLNSDAPPSFSKSYATAIISGYSSKELRVNTAGKTWYLGVYGQDSDNFTISTGAPASTDDELTTGQRVTLVIAIMVVVIGLSLLAAVLIGLIVVVVRRVVSQPNPAELEMNAVNASSTDTSAPQQTSELPSYLPPTVDSTSPAPIPSASAAVAASATPTYSPPRRGDDEDDSSEMSGIKNPSNVTGYARF